MRTLVPCLSALVLFGCAASGGGADAVVSQPAVAAPEHLTLDRLIDGPPLAGVSPSAPVWAPDSARLAFRWRGESGSREVWVVEADGSGLRQLTGGGDARGGVGGFVWLPDGDGLLYQRAGGLWRTDLEGASARVCVLEGASDLAVAPDGRFASVLRGGDLWLVDLEDGSQRRLTEVGVPSISKVSLGRYRRPEVEIGPYVWGGPTYAWAPGGRTIAVHHVDRREVRTVPFPHYLGEETDPNLVRRSYPGDPNERRTVALVDVATGALQWLELDDPTGTRIADFAWSPDGRLLVDRESDTAVDRWLHVFDPASGELRQVFHDRRETRVYTTVGSAWHADGEHVIVLGDLADRYGLYALDATGAEPEPRLLTDPRFDVMGGPLVAADGAIFYPSNEPHPHEQHVFCVGLDGTAPTRVTGMPGTASPYPSPDGRRVAVLHSDDITPTELYFVDASGGGEAQRITRSTPREFDDLDLARPRYVTFPSLTDDATLHARILTPAGIDPTDSSPGRRYPVVFGPVYSNTVRNRWAGFYGLFQQLLVQEGYAVVQVDVRGSTGYGRAFREGFLMDFAGRDLDDLESAVAYLESQPWVDPDRIGIWGSSYGGTLTVYSLLKKPGLFDAGVACAAAVDPHFFGGDDVAIVRRPETHPEAFTRGAAQFAANLEDPLLLIHGMQDQVVPFKTIVDLMEALMRAGKDFDVAIAPGGTHGWSGPRHYARYLFGKLLAHFERHLRGG